MSVDYHDGGSEDSSMILENSLGFLDLDNDSMYIILTFLSAKDLCSVEQAHSEMKIWTRDTRLWKMLYIGDFFPSVEYYHEYKSIIQKQKQQAKRRRNTR